MSSLNTEIQHQNDQQVQQHDEEENKQDGRMFDVVFKNVRLPIRLTADMTIGQAKTKVKRLYGSATNDNGINGYAMRVRNPFIRIVSCHKMMLSDADKLTKFLRFDVQNTPREELVFEEAIGTLLRTQNGSYNFPLWPSDPIDSVFVKAFNVVKSVSGQVRYWFNLYLPDYNANLRRRGLNVQNVLKNMDLLEIRYNHPRDNKRKMSIFVKTLTGKTITFEALADGTDTIRDLKFWIECVQGVPADDQRIVYAGGQLSDDWMLCDCKIRQESTIHLVLRMRGS